MKLFNLERDLLRKVMGASLKGEFPELYYDFDEDRKVFLYNG